MYKNYPDIHADFARLISLKNEDTLLPPMNQAFPLMVNLDINPLFY
jgi:hypothetical protein